MLVEKAVAAVQWVAADEAALEEGTRAASGVHQDAVRVVDREVQHLQQVPHRHPPHEWETPLVPAPVRGPNV